MRILIAEDDAVSRLKLEFMLKASGWDVTCVSDGAQAMTVLEADDSPLLAILDWNMPVFTGPEICLRARRIYRPVPQYLILLTSKSNKQDIVFGLEAGANDYLTKPCDWNELQARLCVGGETLELHQRLAERVRETQEALSQIEQLHESLNEANGNLKESNRKLKLLSTLDGLMGIANRRHFDEVLGLEWRRALRKGESLTLMMIDVDCFKAFNDVYGHQKGDDCLKAVAGALQGYLRHAGDLLARYGGEEFIALIPSKTASESLKHAELMRTAVEELAITYAGNLSGNVVTISLGIASVVPHKELSPSNLIRFADEALYLAKGTGRNRVVIYPNDDSLLSMRTLHTIVKTEGLSYV